MEGFDDVGVLLEDVVFFAGVGGDVVEGAWSNEAPLFAADGVLFIAGVVGIGVTFSEFSFESGFGPAAFVEEEVPVGPFGFGVFEEGDEAAAFEADT